MTNDASLPSIRMSRADMKAILLRATFSITVSELFVFAVLYATHSGPAGFAYGAFFSFVCPAAISPYFTWKDLKRVRQMEYFQKRMEVTNRQLQTALSEVRELRGLLPICAACKKIRNDEGVWDQIETYISRHTDAKFTHAICPECTVRLYGEDIGLPEMAAQSESPS